MCGNFRHFPRLNYWQIVLTFFNKRLLIDYNNNISNTIDNNIIIRAGKRNNYLSDNDYFFGYKEMFNRHIFKIKECYLEVIKRFNSKLLNLEQKDIFNRF